MAGTEVWTEDMINILVSDWESSSANAIAKKINKIFGTAFSKNSVVGKIHRCKLPHKPSPLRRASNGTIATRHREPIPDDVRAHVTELAMQCRLGRDAIHKRTGYRHNVVARILETLPERETNRTPNLTPEQHETILALAAQGLGRRSIQTIVKLSEPAIRKVLKSRQVQKVPAFNSPHDGTGSRVITRVDLATFEEIDPEPMPLIFVRPTPEPIRLARGNCVFPIGEPRTKEFRYCDDAAVRGSYCAAHATICYVARAA